MIVIMGELVLFQALFFRLFCVDFGDFFFK